jgi:DNA polymerase-1
MGRFEVLPISTIIRTRKQAEDALAELQQYRVVALDTETTGLRRSRDYAVIISLSTGHNRYVIFPEAFPFFREYLEDPELKLIMWNANFDTWMLLKAGIDIYRRCPRANYRVFDAMVMHALAYDDRPHTLKLAAREYLGIRMVEFTKVFGPWLKKKIPLKDLFLDPANESVVANYAGLDAYATLRLFVAIRQELISMATGNPWYPTLWEYFLRTEVPFTRVLYECERNGVAINKQHLLQIAPELDFQLQEIQRWFVRETRDPVINLKSTPQMCKLFFERLGYEPPSYTASGQPQLAKKWLAKIAGDGDEFAIQLLKHRDISKKLNTYVRGIIKLIGKDGRLHTSFNQTGARTGRLSSSNPNLQNQPVYIRDAYISEPNTKMGARDYQQLEMCVLAHFSGDDNLIAAIIDGKDLHAWCASLMFKVPYQDIIDAKDRDDEIAKAKKAKQPFTQLTEYESKLLYYRKAAKSIGFGLVYGMGPNKLARELKITVDDAKALMERYFAAFPGVKRYFTTAIAESEAQGFCTTILGRRRQLPGLYSSINADRAGAIRKIKNSRIQGTAAEIAKLAMIRVYEDEYLTACSLKMQLNVHDEVVYCIPDELEGDTRFERRLCKHMEHPLPFDLSIPLRTSGKYGDNWSMCK